MRSTLQFLGVLKTADSLAAVRTFGCDVCGGLVFIENFAHDLHLRDTVQTAAEYGVVVNGPRHGRGPGLQAAPGNVAPGLDELVATWLPLTYALNAVNRSTGKDDLYPFVLTPPGLAKLRVVHDILDAAAASRGAGTRVP